MLPEHVGVQPQIEILDLTKLDTANWKLRSWTLRNEEPWLQPQLGPAMAWVDDHLVYVLNEAPPSQNDSNVWWTKIDSRLQAGGHARRLTSSPGSVQYLSVSDDGKRLAYLKQGWQPDVYVAKLEANGTRLRPPKRLDPG